MRRRDRDIPLARLAVAVAVSLGCHAAVALALGTHGWRSPSAVPRSMILVRALAGGEPTGTAGDGVTARPAPSDAVDVASPPGVSRPPERPRIAPRRVPKPASVARGPVAEARGSAVAKDSPAPAPAGDAGGGSAGAGGSGIAAGGGGAGGDGVGGGGADGLRVWCRSCPIPEYPARARREGWQGTVDVELRVNGDGTVEQASVGRSSGFVLLDAAAVTVARRSRFRLPDNGAGLRGQLRYRFVLEEAVAKRLL